MKTSIWLCTGIAVGLIGCFQDNQPPAPPPPTASISRAFTPTTPNDCNSLLVDGVFDEHDVFGSLYQQKVFLNRFCSSRYQSLQDAQSDSLNATIPIEEVMVGFGFSGSSSTFKTDYDTLCSQQDAFVTTNRQSSDKIRIADATLAKEFRKCVAGQSFSAYLVPADTKQFQIIARYQSPTSDEPYDTVNSLSYDHTSGRCERPPSKIGSQGVTINCHRNDDNVAFQIALNTQAGTAPFRVPVPPQNTKAQPPVSQQLVNKIASGQTFTVIFANALPGGHMGAIYPGVALNGTYTQGTQTWRVWGLSAGLHPPSVIDVSTPGTYDPRQHGLELWGVGLTFDDLGNVYVDGLGNPKVGFVIVLDVNNKQ
jgi:hypothetical protein